MPDQAGPPAPTMFDVAQRAGVSHMTVSRLINGHPGVSAATREKVEAAIAELRYTPSSAARAMARRRSGVLGLIQAGRPDWGPSSAALGFNEAAVTAGYTVSQTSLRALRASVLTQAVRRLVGQRVEAIVLIAGEREAAELVAGLEVSVPVVAVASESVAGLRRVSFDQYLGARLATRHLVELGHREIRHVAGPAGSMDAAERVRGWRDELVSQGLGVVEPVVADWSPSAGASAAAEVLDDADATAVFAGSDQIALGLLHAVSQAGRRVPADLSAVGFDDLPEAAYFAPPLTTMRQDFAALGRDVMAAVSSVLTGEDDASAPENSASSRVPELVVRQSTAQL